MKGRSFILNFSGNLIEFNKLPQMHKYPWDTSEFLAIILMNNGYLLKPASTRGDKK